MIDPLDPKSLEASRESAGLSRADLARLSGVHVTTIMRIEAGKVDPRLDGTWVPLVKALTRHPEPQGAEAAAQRAGTAPGERTA